MESEGNGMLVVERTSDDDIKIRDLYVKVDDFSEGNVEYGDRLELPLQPGKHQLKITNRLFTQSADFDLKPGETVRFEATNVLLKGVFLPLMIVSGTGMYKVRLRRSS
ncbi:MAG TPA: hypothetical protein VG944_03415 [Fimbriimonas sp.]|nr:hypothetical protein [Fimbriimonas sp.]